MNLDRLKNHLYVEHCEDDVYIEFLYDAVKGQAEGYLNASIVDSLTVVAEGEEAPREVVMDNSIEAALYVGVAYIYEDRGDDNKNTQGVKDHQLPSAFHSLLINKRIF